MEKEKLMDFYELTMSYCDFKKNKYQEKCYFDVFFRKNADNGGYNIACGLDNIIEYIQNLRFSKEDIEYLRNLNVFDEDFLEYLKNFRFTGDIYAVEDGTVVFAGEPCLRVHGNTIEAQMIETDILNKFNHGSLIATKANKIVNAANGRAVMEFGARHAQGANAAIEGAKYAYIAGCVGTSCYEAGKKYNIPLLGTMAHSHMSKYNSEYEAFLAFAEVFKSDSILLVDTFDTLKSGVPNAIRVAKEYLIPNGYRLKGIRLDSGDLAYLSKEARRMLDEAGLEDTKICVSNSLDEYTIESLLQQGAPIDIFGVGENLITAKSNPVFGGVYKLSAMEQDGKVIPKIKLSDNVGKITNPGYKKVYRFYDKETGYALGDVITLADEIIPTEGYTLIAENEEWKKTHLTNYVVRELQVPIFKNGNLAYKQPTLKEKQEYCKKEVMTLYPEIKRLSNPHKYYVDLSQKLMDLKKELIYSSLEQLEEKGAKLVHERR